MNRKERRAQAARAKHLPMAGRQCGGCTECCTVLGVPELGKAFYKECQHEGDHGCLRYANRPQKCRNFSCQWLLGVMGVEDRPDKLGVIFDVTAGGSLGQIPVAVEVRQGSSLEGRAQEVIREVARRSPVLVISPDGNHRLEGAPDGAGPLDLVGMVPRTPS